MNITYEIIEALSEKYGYIESADEYGEPGYNVSEGKHVKIRRLRNCVERERSNMFSKKMKPTKYLYGWKIQVNYGQRWEYEVFETTWKEAKQRLKEYRDNCGYPVRAIKGKELR